ncbi:MAG: acetyl-CoA carboxylase biotin carboxyl carrier protein subunit, partial [Proteobacteria bacterium]|nr:acetyl-CoA carboxylase biotin carboxyl carrier protein subunit [Pseudomonadota bacterium]
GKIIAVKCSPGQTVKRCEVVIILEAMKMEQEIKAKADGVISEIKVSAGMSVQKEDVLLIIS